MLTFPKLLPSPDPKAEANRDRIDTWWFLLKDLEGEAFLYGCARTCQETAEIYPNTNIVALIRNAAMGSREDVRNRALIAWQEVDDALQRAGTYATVQFEDRVIHSCIKALGGWRDLGLTLRDEMKWQRKAFLELYAVYARHSSHPEKLAGITEEENRAGGFLDCLPEPIRIEMMTAKPLLPEAKAPLLVAGVGRS